MNSDWSNFPNCLELAQFLRDHQRELDRLIEADKKEEADANLAE